MNVTIDDPLPAPVNGWGGARPGAGRKRKAPPDPTIRAEVRRVVVDQVMPDLAEMIEALKRLALGAKVIGRVADAGEIVYETPPDALALACLLSLVDRVA
jgi:hypothetical protein